MPNIPNTNTHFSGSMKKPTLWTLRKVSTRISLSMPRRLNLTDTFRLLWILFFRNPYSIPLSAWDGKCRPGLACADCVGRSWSIYYVLIYYSTTGIILHCWFIPNVSNLLEYARYQPSRHCWFMPDLLIYYSTTGTGLYCVFMPDVLIYYSTSGTRLVAIVGSCQSYQFTIDRRVLD